MSWHGVLWALGGVAAGLALLRATPVAKVVLWSPMRGRVLLNGQPAAGAVLVREYDWHWGGKTGTDRTTTDANGEFTFPAISGRMLLGLVLLHQPVTRQAMTVEHLGVSYHAWNFHNMGYSLNAENGGRPIVVTCRLEAERRAHGGVSGLCEFE